ncbi:hypothetical protein FBU30_001221 [Linnemannia zychae]|nr:hypothetical protein FBU30_001221 [Linnemannia zychae]
MGVAISRDHAKLPFGYTHARKDHSYNNSPVSRRKLTPRLLRTSDTTSVTPFPIQETTITNIPHSRNSTSSSTLASISSIPNNNNCNTTTYPETTQYISSSLSRLLILPPATLDAISNAPTSNSHSNAHWKDTANSNGSITNNDNKNTSSENDASHSIQSSATTTFFVPDSGTDAFDHTGFNESNHSQNLIQSTNQQLPTDSQSHDNQHRFTVTASCSEQSDNNSNHATLSPSSGSSIAWSNSNRAIPTAMTNPDLVAHATSSSSMLALQKTRMISAVRLGQPGESSSGPLSSSPLQKQWLSQSMRTQEEQENDMDIISALEIAEKAPYDFFSPGGGSSNSASNINNSSRSSATELSLRHHHHHYHHHHSIHNQNHSSHAGTLYQQRSLNSTNFDAATSVPLIPGGSRLEHDDERMLSSSNRRTRYHPETTLDAFDEEQQNKQYYQQHKQRQDEVDMELDMGEEGLVRFESNTDDLESIIGVELGHLSPFPFSELPSLTSIGLCSRGIVRLSSNIKLLASATCVQICCNELDSIPIEIGFLRNLTLLDLTKNCLKSLPDSIIHLSKLVELKLSFNQLETIPAGIGGLTKLASLVLDNNRITSIPSQIGHLKELVHLDLSDNPIMVLPAEVGKLQFLRRLKLDRCPLVKEFTHSPVHSPPTLLELAARVIVRHDVKVPKMMLPHLKDYIDSAQSCTFCDGPYFDSWVKRGKLIEKNEILVPLEYSLCQPHWNTEMERVKLLFCPRPITSPRPKTASPLGVQRCNSNKNIENTSAPTKKQTVRSNSSDTVTSESSKSPELFSADSYRSTASSSSTANSPAMSASSPTMTSDSGNEEQQLMQRVRPTLKHRLSMLLKPKSERQERPLSAFFISTPSSTSTSTASSPSLEASPTMGDATSPPSITRPSILSRASSGFFGRNGFRSSRPTSMVVRGSSAPMAASSPAIVTLSTLSTSG